MLDKAKPARDAFTFSLGGMKTISSFIAAPAIADDQLNRDQNSRLKQAGRNRGRRPRIWTRIQRQTAHCDCA
jgi:hypothetical protein